MYEIQSAHRNIQLNLPVIVGMQILYQAKLEMLKFYYNFITYFIPRHLVGTVLMDTGKQASQTKCVIQLLLFFYLS